MKILSSARKHGVTDKDIDQVYVYGEEFELDDPSPDGNPVVMNVGWGLDAEDLVEIKIEILDEPDEDGEEIIVFHADRATGFWRMQFEERRPSV